MRTASITVLRPRAETERLWREPRYRPRFLDEVETSVRFTEAPGDHGTEIQVTIATRPPAGKVGEAVQKLLGNEPRAKVKDGLRRFKQLVETGVITRSDAVPEGELLERKRGQRPAQPLERDELAKAGA